LDNGGYLQFFQQEFQRHSIIKQFPETAESITIQQLDECGKCRWLPVAAAALPRINEKN